MKKPIVLSIPDELLEHILSFIHLDKDRNSISLVCKLWYEIERCCRRKLIIRNSYAVSPETVIRRFPEVRSVEIKGKPQGCGGDVYPWIKAMSSSYKSLEEIRLKRMKVSNECLELIANSFKNLKVYVLSSCQGFSIDVLVGAACRIRNVHGLQVSYAPADNSNDYMIIMRKSERD